MNSRVPILMYHSVADEGPPGLAPWRVSCAAFQQQMRFLRHRGFYTISLDEWAASILAKRLLPGRPVIITFDDGYQNFFINAWPALESENLRATIFVVTGRVGSVVDWDHHSGPPMPLMSWDQLRILQSAGNTIGSHCTAHQNLTELSDAALAADCIEARRMLSRELGRELTSIAFPWGLSNIRVRRILAENGYRIGVGVTGGLSSFADELMHLPRIEIFGEDDLDAFALKIDADGHELDTAVDLRGTATPEPNRQHDTEQSVTRPLRSAWSAALYPAQMVFGNPERDRRVAVVLTSCGRQDLLERTLDSFLAFNTYPIAQIIVVEDGPGAANENLKAKYTSDAITWLATESRVGQITAIDYAYSFVNCPYIFHTEDDWEFLASGFIEKSLAVLEYLPSCIQVWIRALDDTMGHPLCNETTIIENVPVRRAEFGHGGHWHGFTFNPGLRRAIDYHRLGSYGSHVTDPGREPGEAEYRLSEIYRQLGFYAVILADNGGAGYVRHTGYGRRISPIRQNRRGHPIIARLPMAGAVS